MKTEKEFELEVKRVKEQLKTYREEISAIINKVSNLSEETGVPVNFDIRYEVDQSTYTPESMKEKWPDLSEKFVKNFLESFEYMGQYDDERPTPGVWACWRASTIGC